MPVAFYRRNLPHLPRDAKPHFLTFCTFRRWMLPEWARDIVMDCCVKAHGFTIDLYVAVVMPDHVHLIFVPEIDTTLREVYSLARIMKAIKGTSAHAINRHLQTHGRVWQEESFDHVLRCSEKLDEKVGYVMANPVRRGLVSRAEDYRWLWVPERLRIR